VNIDFPFHLDDRGRVAATDDANHIRDLVEQFLFTNVGERVNRPEFGSSLLQLVFAPNSPELAAALQFTVQAGLQRWLSDLIDVRRLDVESHDSRLRVEIELIVRRTGESRTEVFERSVS
jgi:phage baseplate assembly protein W